MNAKMLQDFAVLLISLGVILLGAKIFTNGIEWLGKKLRLAEGAVGSVLAAVGTALPETMIPLTAILFGSEDIGKEIGIGAILGAPFMLSTLAFFVTGVAVVLYRKSRCHFPVLNVNLTLLKRDLSFFIIVYSIALLAAFTKLPLVKDVIICLLVLAYILYLVLTIRTGKVMSTAHKASPCLFCKKSNNPPLKIIIFQVICALCLIVVSAKVFVNGIEQLSLLFGIPGFILALIIAPVATELPEKFNSIIWIAHDRDTLAIGNITGAMVFQSSLIPALGIALTTWSLNTNAVISVFLALTSALLLLIQVNRKGYLTCYMLMFSGVYYLLFIWFIISSSFS